MNDHIERTCHIHSGLEVRVERNEKDIQTLYSRVNGMIRWVIAGMGSMIAYFLVLGADRVFETVRRGTGH